MPGFQRYVLINAVNSAAFQVKSWRQGSKRASSATRWPTTRPTKAIAKSEISGRRPVFRHQKGAEKVASLCRKQPAQESLLQGCRISCWSQQHPCVSCGWWISVCVPILSLMPKLTSRCHLRRWPMIARHTGHQTQLFSPPASFALPPGSAAPPAYHRFLRCRHPPARWVCLHRPQSVHPN